MYIQLIGNIPALPNGAAETAEIEFSKLKFLPGVKTLAQSGVIPGGTREKLDATGWTVLQMRAWPFIGRKCAWSRDSSMTSLG